MFCSKCGNQNRDEARFCFECGFDLTTSRPPSSAPPDLSMPGSGDGAMNSIGAGETALPTPEMYGPEAVALGPNVVVAGRYRIKSAIGQGGMGTVYLAHDSRMQDQAVVLKFINPDLLQRSASASERFLSEARTCLDLSHENIIRVHYLDEWQGSTFLAMEYIDGVELGDLLKRYKSQKKRLTWNQFRGVMAQILEGVAYAHSRSIIHRDLKPANIMIARKSAGGQRAVVMDFGLAKVSEGLELTGAGKGLGTAYYMAPEQRRNAKTVTARADVFALGVIAYEMLTLRTTEGRVHPPSQLRDDLPNGVDDWVFQAMEHDASERYGSAREMLAALKAVGAEQENVAAAENRETQLRHMIEIAAADGSISAGERSVILKKAEGLGIAAEKANGIMAEMGGMESVVNPQGDLTLDLGKGVSLDLTWIEGGSFEMGDDMVKPIHTVEVDGFWMGRTQVTQGQYEAVMGNNPSLFKGASNPVERVSWHDAMAFCSKVAERSGQKAVLPTEAQWEYACRAGSTSKWCFGDSESALGEYAWFDDNSGDKTHPVGEKKANRWGLFDMHGNVWEWCLTKYKDYPYRADDGRNDESGDDIRVLRGGSWFAGSVFCRSAYRFWYFPTSAYFYVGFRICVVVCR